MRRRANRWALYLLVVVAAALPAAAEAAGDSGPASADTALWQLIRASGLVAFVLLSAAVFLGVAVNVRALDALMKRSWVNEGHQTLSVAALAFTGLHVALLLANRHVQFTLVGVLVPFASGWRPLPSALGTIAVYLSLLLVATSYARARIGQRTWRAVHYAGFAGWAMALVHGVASGADSGAAAVQYLYLFSGAAVGFVTLFRLLAPSGRSRPPQVKADAGERRFTTR